LFKVGLGWLYIFIKQLKEKIGDWSLSPFLIYN